MFQVVKRDGEIADFQLPKISAAIQKAFEATNKQYSPEILELLALREAMALLPQREQTVLVLRYFRDLTQQKVAQILGVSQVQVSRIEKKAIAKVKKILEDSG